jgi:hypothetical protein
MRKVLTFLSKTIATIFAILFVIMTVLVLLLFNIERKILSADLYTIDRRLERAVNR